MDMDEVDRHQEDEIISLQKKDIAHDKDLDWMKFAMRTLGFAFTLWVIASTTIIFVLIDKLDKIIKP